MQKRRPFGPFALFLSHLCFIWRHPSLSSSPLSACLFVCLFVQPKRFQPFLISSSLFRFHAEQSIGQNECETTQLKMVFARNREIARSTICKINCSSFLVYISFTEVELWVSRNFKKSWHLDGASSGQQQQPSFRAVNLSSSSSISISLLFSLTFFIFLSTPRAFIYLLVVFKIL